MCGRRPRTTLSACGTIHRSRCFAGITKASCAPTVLAATELTLTDSHRLPTSPPVGRYVPTIIIAILVTLHHPDMRRQMSPTSPHAFSTRTSSRGSSPRCATPRSRITAARPMAAKAGTRPTRLSATSTSGISGRAKNVHGKNMRSETGGLLGTLHPFFLAADYH